MQKFTGILSAPKFTRISPLLFILFVTCLVFRNFIFEGLLPIPADILVGSYFPWLDYKWGYVVGVPVKNPLPSDVISILYPWRVLGMEIWKSGSWPLWDPTSLLGVPLLANFQAALLNPLNVLFFVLPNHLAWSVQVLLQPVFISLATYLFLRNLSLGKIASLFGSLAFAFSGFSVVWMEYNTIGYTLVFFPLSLLIIDKIIAGPKVAHAFWLGLFLCLQILSGYPQISLYTIAFSLVYFIFRAISHKQITLSRCVLYFLGVSTALGLAAIQLMPSMELLKLSIRSFDNTAVAGGIQFLPWQHLITLAVPDFFGNPATGNYWSVGSFDNFALFMPAAALYFALLSFLSKAALKKKNLVFIVFLVASLLLATDNIISNAVARVDALGLKSAVAARVLFVFDFVVAILAAIELDRVLSGGTTKAFYRLVPVAVYVGILLGTAVSIVYLRRFIPPDIFNLMDKIPEYDRRVIEAVGIIVKDLRAGEVNYQVALRNTLLPVASAIITFGVIFTTKFRRVFVVLIFGVLLIGILRATDKYLTFASPALLYPSVEGISQLKMATGFHRFDREQAEIFPSNVWVPYGLKAASGQNNLLPMSSAIYFSLVNEMYPNLVSRYVDIYNVGSPLYDTLDIKYVALLNRDEIKSTPDPSGRPFKNLLLPKLQEVSNSKTVRIMENSSNLGFAWFSENVACLNDREKFIEQIKDKDYQPKKLVIINCPDGYDLEERRVGVADVVQDLPGRLKIVVDTPSENYLIISMANFPGWKASVDGSETGLYSANVALMSLLVQSGRHIVELKYEPDRFYDGIKLSSATLSAWVIVFLIQTILGRYKRDVKK